MSSTHSPNRSSALSSLSPPPPPPPTLSPLPNLPSSPFLFHNPIFDNTEYVVKKLHPASFNHNSPTTVEFKESLVRAIQKDPSRLPSHLILLPPSPRFTRYSPKSAASPLPSPPTPPLPKFQNPEIAASDREAAPSATNHCLSHYTIQQSFQQSWRQFRGFGGTRDERPLALPNDGPTLTAPR